MKEPIQQPAASIDNTFPMLQQCVTELKNIVRMQQRRITIDVNEYNYTLNDTSLRVSPRSRSAIHVTSFFASATSNAVVTIGPHVFAFTAAQSPFHALGISWVINQDDIRQITQQTIGAMSLEIFGEEYGDVGVL